MRNLFKTLTNRCVKCGVMHTNTYKRWCKSCQINYYKDFTNYKNEIIIIDKLIQKMQLKIINTKDIIFEWINYDQFNDIEKLNENDSFKIYSAIWKDGPLYWNNKSKEYIRNSNEMVALKYLNNENLLKKVK
jgi:hypothetical protein